MEALILRVHIQIDEARRLGRNDRHVPHVGLVTEPTRDGVQVDRIELPLDLGRGH